MGRFKGRELAWREPLNVPEAPTLPSSPGTLIILHFMDRKLLRLSVIKGHPQVQRQSVVARISVIQSPV